jgi:bifunctional non-homologous end joining protein LigD
MACEISLNDDAQVVTLDGEQVRLTKLEKLYWPEDGITKGDLLQFYADIADILVPHLYDRGLRVNE